MIFCFNPSHEVVVWQHSEEDLQEYGSFDPGRNGPWRADYIYFFADLDTKEY